MHNAASGAVVLIGNKSVEHLVIHDVFDIPPRDKRAVQERRDADLAILFLNTTERDVLPRPPFALSPPLDGVVLEPISKIAAVHTIENRAEIKIDTV